MSALLEVKQLSVSISANAGVVHAVKDVNLALNEGEVLAVVGESGCGKTMLCKAIMKLLPESAQITGGSIVLGGMDITACSERDMCGLRGKVVSMIFQDPMTSLDPTMTIGTQISEAVCVHNRKLKKRDVYARVIELMELAGIENPEESYRLYPYHFSGGMRQRSVIAMALAGNPRILLADEPTTALDVTIQTQILDLLRNIQKKLNTAVILVSHDPGAVARVADRIAVMRAGEVVENGTPEKIYYHPAHPCTQKLLSAHAAQAVKEENLENRILVDVQHLSHSFRVSKNLVIRAVDDVSFQIRRGEIFGLIGESGCGKSTVARCMMNLYQPTAGHIFYDGIDTCDKKEYRKYRKRLETERQLIFQDSAASLDWRMRIGDLIAEPMVIHHIKPPRGRIREEAAFWLHSVGLGESYLDKYPSQLSGGQCQRVAVARALSMEPKLLVADEPTASLDVSRQAHMIQLFRHLQEEHGFSILFIAHDLAVVEHLCQRVGVMYRGKLVELAPVKQLFEHPLHAYTHVLLSSMPVPDPVRERARRRVVIDRKNLSIDGVMREITPGHFVREEQR